ncbi:hypothetical protein NDU88_004141 [Pleurodeles waltl]|uniref:Secreted protein n=1 Tax=Pleurodeles waltl TaxID=8319 RepID=A0AAV7W465_PLEWA|nr:hypothetical protein NDU88_004141 [Pleurodeles waltl]
MVPGWRRAQPPVLCWHCLTSATLGSGVPRLGLPQSPLYFRGVGMSPVAPCSSFARARPGTSRRRTTCAPLAHLGIPAASLHARRLPVLLLCSGLAEPPTTLTSLGGKAPESPPQFTAGRHCLRHSLGVPSSPILPRTCTHRNSSPLLLVAGQATGSSRRQRGPDPHARAQKGLCGSPAVSLGHLPQCQHGLPRGRLLSPG